MKKIILVLSISLCFLSCDRKVMDGKDTSRESVDSNYIPKRDGVNVKQVVLGDKPNLKDSVVKDTMYFYEYNEYLSKGEKGTLITSQLFQPGQFVYDEENNVLEITSKPRRILELKP